jgi:hypothetical protein
MDVSAQAFMGQDTDAGTEPYYLQSWDRRDADPNDNDSDWILDTKNGLLVDADEGVLFTIEKPSGDTVKLEKQRISGGLYTSIVYNNGWSAFGLDRKNKRVYAVMETGYVDGQGLYRINYAGRNRTKVTSLFSGGEDLAIDPNGSTLILGGHDMLQQEFSLIKTDISSPARSVSEKVPEYGGTNPAGYVFSIAVDWTNGWLFAIEGGRRYLVKRQLSDFSQVAEHDFGFQSNYQVGLAADPVGGRVYVQWEQEILSAPYSDLSNQTVEQTEWVAWPAVAVESGANAPPLHEERSRVEWRR